MKQLPIPLLVLSLILLFSCNIEKRHYRPGFYIPQKHFVASQIFKQSPAENTDTLIVTQDVSVDTPLQQKQTGLSVDKNGNTSHMGNSCSRSFSPKLLLKKSNKIPVFKVKKERERNHNNYGRNSVDDVLVIIGCVLMLIGLVILLIGVGVMKANPVLSNAFVIFGVVLFCLGLIIGIIGDPSIIFDVLFAFLDAI